MAENIDINIVMVIIDLAKVEAENMKKEEIIKAKEEIMKDRDELDKEIKERRSEVQKQESRIQHKEQKHAARFLPCGVLFLYFTVSSIRFAKLRRCQP